MPSKIWLVTSSDHLAWAFSKKEYADGFIADVTNLAERTSDFRTFDLLELPLSDGLYRENHHYMVITGGKKRD